MGACSPVRRGETQPNPAEAGSEQKITPVSIPRFYTQLCRILPDGGFYLHKLFAWPGFGFSLMDFLEEAGRF